jgi:hypothetical protein
MDIDSFIDPILDVIRQLIGKIHFSQERIVREHDSEKYKEQFKETFGNYATPYQGLYAFLFIENIVLGIKRIMTTYNPATTDDQRLTNKTAHEVADFIIEMCRDIKSMLEIMCDKGQTDCAGLLELTIKSYPRITYTNCNKATLETARTNQIKPLRNVVFTQINSEQALQRQLAALQRQLAASQAENRVQKVSYEKMLKEKDHEGGLNSVSRVDMGELRGLLCELGSL